MPHVRGAEVYYIDKPTSVIPEKLKLTTDAPTIHSAKNSIKKASNGLAVTATKREAPKKPNTTAPKPTASATPEQQGRKICETLPSFSTLRFTMAKYTEEDLLKEEFADHMRFFWGQENFTAHEPELQGNSFLVLLFLTVSGFDQDQIETQRKLTAQMVSKQGGCYFIIKDEDDGRVGTSGCEQTVPFARRKDLSIFCQYLPPFP